VHTDKLEEPSLEDEENDSGNVSPLNEPVSGLGNDNGSFEFNDQLPHFPQ